MKTIYIVCADWGAYSDRSDWRVRAFVDEEAAKAFCKNCNDQAALASKATKGDLSYTQRQNIINTLRLSFLDPDMYVDGSDVTDYRVEKLELDCTRVS